MNGIQGRTYAKGKSVKKTLSIPQIKPYVDRFVQYANEHPEKEFLVTLIGCGLAKIKPKQIAPLFKDAASLENVLFPNKFWHKLKEYVVEDDIL